MKGLVIYKGRYGATKQYAAWIGQELELTVASSDKFPEDELNKHDFFIIGSSVYMGQLEIKKWLKNNIDVLINKKVFFFQVAASSVDETKKREKLEAKIKEINLQDSLRKVKMKNEVDSLKLIAKGYGKGKRFVR